MNHDENILKKPKLRKEGVDAKKVEIMMMMMMF
jgi:hypothetical protein